MDPYNSLSFKKKDLDFKDTVVTLLIDNSGSMREDLLRLLLYVLIFYQEH